MSRSCGDDDCDRSRGECLRSLNYRVLAPAPTSLQEQASPRRASGPASAAALAWSDSVLANTNHHVVLSETPNARRKRYGVALARGGEDRGGLAFEAMRQAYREFTTAKLHDHPGRLDRTTADIVDTSRNERENGMEIEQVCSVEADRTVITSSGSAEIASVTIDPKMPCEASVGSSDSQAPPDSFVSPEESAADDVDNADTNAPTAGPSTSISRSMITKERLRPLFPEMSEGDLEGFCEFCNTAEGRNHLRVVLGNRGDGVKEVGG